MEMALVFWLANLLPQPVADQVCLATTVYLEARKQSELVQRAVAEVALRRLDSGRWGDSLCEVVTAPKQFAPTLVRPDYRIVNLKAWNRAVRVALDMQTNWIGPRAQRRQIVPDADHFVANAIASPNWAQGIPVAVIGDHTFYKVRPTTRRL